jgi:hypothetical protein
MEIIGENGDTLILSASRREVANIIGVYSDYTEGGRVKTGSEIKVSDVFSKYYSIMKAHQKIKEIKMHCSSILDSVQTVESIIPPEEEVKS